MGALLHMGSLLAAMAVSSLVSAVWEGALLAGCVYLFLRMFPGLRVRGRSCKREKSGRFARRHRASPHVRARGS